MGVRVHDPTTAPTRFATADDELHDLTGKRAPRAEIPPPLKGILPPWPRATTVPGRKTTCLRKAWAYRFRMPSVLPLKSMTRVEKLRAMEEIWTDLTRDDNKFYSPSWHADVLRETEKAVAAGTAMFVNWEEAKKRLRRKTTKLS